MSKLRDPPQDLFLCFDTELFAVVSLPTLSTKNRNNCHNLMLLFYRTTLNKHFCHEITIDAIVFIEADHFVNKSSYLVLLQGGAAWMCGALTEARFLEMSLRSRAYIASRAPTSSMSRSSLSSMVV